MVKLLMVLQFYILCFLELITLILAVKVSAEVTDVLIQLQLDLLRLTILRIPWFYKSTSSLPVVAFPRGWRTLILLYKGFAHSLMVFFICFFFLSVLNLRC